MSFSYGVMSSVVTPSPVPPDLSSVVPYTGSLRNTDLGVWSLYASGLFLNNISINSTGLIGLTCSDGEILEFETSTGLWECGTDSTGASESWVESNFYSNSDNIIATGYNITADNLIYDNYVTIGNISYTGNATSVVADLGTNLKARWSMDEDTTSTTVTDDINSNNGIAQANTDVMHVEGKVGTGALNIGGVNAISLGSISSTSQTYTYSAWVKGTSLTNLQYLIDTQNGRVLFSWTNNAGQVGFYDGTWRGFSVSPPNDGEWHLMTFVMNSVTGKANYYEDGIQRGTVDVTYTPQNFGTATYMGSSYIGTGTKFSGSLDEVRLYERALSETDILGLYNSGIGTNSTSTNFRIDGILMLDGGTDWVDLGAFEEIESLPALTISAYVKLDSLLKDSSILSKGSTSTEMSLLWFDISGFTGSNMYSFNVGNTGDSKNRIESGTNTAIPNQWQHVVGVMNGSSRYIYIDGVLKNSRHDATITAVPVADDNLLIGKTALTSAFEFEGGLDEIMLFNYALNSTEIYELNRNSYNTTNNKGELVLDGDNDYVTIPNDASLEFGAGESFALTSWIKISDPLIQANGVLTKGYHDTSQNCPMYLFYLSTYNIRLFTRDSSCANTEYIDGTTALNDDKWHHVVGNRNCDTGYMQVYVDGVMEGNVSTTCYAVGGNSDDLIIGNHQNRYTQGSFDEVMIFDRYLTGAEITDMYNLNRDTWNGSKTNLVSYYEFDGIPNNFTDTQETNDGVGVGDAHTTGLYSYYQFDGIPNDFTDTQGNNDGVGEGNAYTTGFEDSPAKSILINNDTFNITSIPINLNTGSKTMSIENDGTNLMFDTDSGIAYFSGDISTTSVIERTTVNNDINVLETFVTGDKLLNDDGTINHKAFGECYEQIEVTPYKIEVTETKEVCVVWTGSPETGSCLSFENVTLTSIKTIKYEDAYDTSCAIAKQTQALAIINTGITVIQENNSTLIDLDVIAVEEILTKSQVPTPTINYCEMIKNANIYDKTTHYAYEERNGQYYLNGEYRWVVLEGCEKQKLNEMCMVSKKYSWCDK